MSWRSLMGSKTDTYTQYTQKPQKGGAQGSFDTIGDIEDKGQKLKSDGQPKDACDFDAEMEAVIHELDRVWDKRGTRMMDVPEDRRQRAFDLEKQITEAANRGDVARFRDALESWRGCWV